VGYIALDAGGDQPAGKGRAQQQVIDAQAGVAGKGFPEIFPERVDPLVGMQRAQRVGPTLRDQAAIGVAHLRPEQGIIDPALRRIDVELGGHHVEVAGQNRLISGPRFLTLGHHRAIQSEPRSPSSHPEAAAQSDELGGL